jgi:DNA invertase Pin-like site-specific DNA recombinase
MKAAIYARVSKEEQHTENQLPELHEFATRNGWEAIEYLEEASGKEGGRRPVMKQLLEDAKARKFSVVVVWKIDRFGRSIKDFIANMEVLNSVDVRFVATSQPIDTDQRSPIGKLIMNLLMLFAEFERDMLLERVRAGVKRFQKDVESGRYGKTVESRSKKNLLPGRPRKTFDYHEAERLRTSGLSIRAIAKAMKLPESRVRRQFQRNQ